MNPLERKAALTLRPYMSKDPVIVDVGSNKGDWAEILGPNAKEIHLFEPNEVLLHYSMVRFESLTNVQYWNCGLFSESKIMKFHYFTNVNNGLSSVYYNQRWVDEGLPMKEMTIRVEPLDDIFTNGPFKGEIDFLKIDVEGADYEVLKGADKLLTEKKIKFIQVEHSDHIKLSGHSWAELVEYVRSKGYDVYDFTGIEFVKASEPYTQENYYIMGEFTQDWNNEFKNSVSKIPKQFKSEVDYQNYHFSFCLEVGAFEGLTTCYICDNLLAPGGRVIVIDPLPDDHNSLPFGEDNKLFEGQYDRFIRNTKGRPVELIRKESRQVYKDKNFNEYRFDFIYIDGDHREDAVYYDGVGCFRVLRKGGFMLFDDYEWRAETKRGIDKFLRDYDRYLEVVQKGYQVMIKKLQDAE